MEIYILLCIIIFLIIYILIISSKNKKKLEQKVDNELIEQYRYLKEKKEKEWNDYCNRMKEDYSHKLKDLEYDIEIKKIEYANKQESLDLLEDIIKKETLKKDTIVSQQTEIIKKEIELYKEKETNKINNDLKDKQLAAESELKEFIEKIASEKLTLEEQKDIIISELNEYKKKRDSINEAILREKEIAEQETFYLLDINQNDQQDISILQDISPRIKNKEILNKLIYETYCRRALQELTKRVCGGEKISGIYKVTYIKTGESYIGKAVDISHRWSDHLKTSLGIGTLASSIFHTRLAKDGIWNYTWEVLEKVDKDKLTEREKYWIDFYGTNKIGMNQRLG